jgi:NAD(P)-dependent dehydrogenase (short-subunit alcohol dehydrogenase family)
MSQALQGKIALVTGGGSGIGRAAAIAFASHGATVVAADQFADRAGETCELIRAAGGKGSARAADVRVEASVAELIAAIVERHGRLDCAFNNAGVTERFGVKLAETDEQDWDRVMMVNLKGVWLCMKHEIRQMLAQGGGSIVNNASAVGLRGSPGAALYSASKHGVVGLTQSAALQYAKSKIRVNAVCPGVIRTPMVEQMDQAQPGFIRSREEFLPMGRLGDPEEIAAAVVWLSSEAASYITGLAMNVDGGWLAR